MRGRFATSDEGIQLIEYQARFLDLIERERIVYTAELLIDGSRCSVSLVAIELTSEGDETLLSFTEQFAFLRYTQDGHDDIAERKGGTQFQLNGLIALLAVSGKAP